MGKIKDLTKSTKNEGSQSFGVPITSGKLSNKDVEQLTREIMAKAAPFKSLVFNALVTLQGGKMESALKSKIGIKLKRVNNLLEVKFTD